MAEGYFTETLDDPSEIESPERVLICSGKIYYDLFERREKLKGSRTAIIRIEQLYPFPSEQLQNLVENYAEADQWIWVQEEPKNMGGWRFVQPYLQNVIDKKVSYIGRRAAASPATGHFTIHKMEQEKILEEAVGRDKEGT